MWHPFNSLFLQLIVNYYICSIDPIHIDDPLFPTNNVGRNCFRIHQCIKVIMQTLVTNFPLLSLTSEKKHVIYHSAVMLNLSCGCCWEWWFLGDCGIKTFSCYLIWNFFCYQVFVHSSIFSLYMCIFSTKKKAFICVWYKGLVLFFHIYGSAASVLRVGCYAMLFAAD
jgi:hypothetical protein